MRLFKFHKLKREDLITIIFALILSIIILVISIIILYINPHEEEVARINATPTPSPTITPTPPFEHGLLPVPYDMHAQEVLLDRVENRRPLTQNDAFAKAKILSYLASGQVSGTVYKTNAVEVYYYKSTDLFQSEILTKDIALAKSETNIWFRTNGMSQQGICNLPLMFYLNYNVVQSLRNTKITFSPLANGC